MASAHVTARSILSSFLPRLSAPTASTTSRNTVLFSRQLSLPLLPRLAFAIPSAIQLNVPGLLEGIWESILRAVPKKKTSHMKQRSRRLAGKGLKDVTSLNKCSACGNVKRAHYLCPFCVAEIKNFKEPKKVQAKELAEAELKNGASEEPVDGKVEDEKKEKKEM
ncbi:putative 54S ribosomal protein L32, mitochondrial [Lachnellula hyalina]|uniref:Large ribosomal subunit protein bL32m n=1 Tax=Lachnellula hyalina TaxID=1316788 RepID=A0A8H8QTU4_9HELO|nr:putative 54S ribosomal protein L32, mitochondrial [Lachnellula hyalina]TVY22634.1 putative 54S ribosomal protein L32, mitochondrial [Lachnellula hyalina]